MVIERPDELDASIQKMLDTDGLVIADVRVAQEENCFPMVPSGAAHNEMILGDGENADRPKVSGEGMALV